MPTTKYLEAIQVYPEKTVEKEDVEEVL